MRQNHQHSKSLNVKRIEIIARIDSNEEIKRDALQKHVKRNNIAELEMGRMEPIRGTTGRVGLSRRVAVCKSSFPWAKIVDLYPTPTGALHQRFILARVYLFNLLFLLRTILTVVVRQRVRQTVRYEPVSLEHSNDFWLRRTHRIRFLSSEPFNPAVSPASYPVYPCVSTMRFTRIALFILFIPSG